MKIWEGYKILPSNINMELSYNSIVRWFFYAKDEFLNFISHPFYDLKLIMEVLMELLRRGSKILYITHDKSHIKKKMELFDCNLGGLIFSEPFTYFDRGFKFDLVIFDDITGISRIDDDFIISYLNRVPARKKIIMSMKELVNARKVYALNNDMIRFKEPRSIQTRIDLNQDIPHVVFKFFEWFFDNKSKVILITKDISSSKNVYNYMKKYISISPKLNNLFIDMDFKSFSHFENRLNLTPYIYVTSINFLNEFYQFILKNSSKVYNFNIVVFFASDRAFNYKNLLSLCGISDFLRDCKNEVIFVSNYENMEILMAKRISRSYNKRIWEFGLKES